MSLLFYVDEKNNVLLRPECYKLSPALRAVSEQDVCFIIYAYDNYSIYRQFPEHDRIRRAMLQVYDDNVPGLLERPTMQMAVEAYKGLQYDRKIELVRTYQKQIDRFTEQMEQETPTGIQKIIIAIDSLRKSITSIEQEISEAVKNKGVIKGDIELSFLEELMQNEKEYKSVIAKK